MHEAGWSWGQCASCIFKPDVGIDTIARANIWSNEIFLPRSTQSILYIAAASDDFGSRIPSGASGCTHESKLTAAVHGACGRLVLRESGD